MKKLSLLEGNTSVDQDLASERPRWALVSRDG
jgi:hypothetical protein